MIRLNAQPANLYIIQVYFSTTNSRNGEIDNIYELFNIITDCYEIENIPNDFFTSKCITIPKKGNANDCSNYRTISILSHASKILLNVIKHRLKNKIEN